jgi:hypothetical protein
MQPTPGPKVAIASHFATPFATLTLAETWTKSGAWIRRRPGTALARQPTMALPIAAHDPWTQTQEHQRHRPEEMVVYQVFQEHWPAFREQAEEAGGLPKFVVREVEDFLRCGRLEGGCLHCECRRCGYSHLVALSCKRRGGLCSSCSARRRADISVHLEEEVLPPVPKPPTFEDPMKAPAWGDQKELFQPTGQPNQAAPYRRPWSWLLRHVFLKDVSQCPRCGRPMRWVEVASSKQAIERLLAQHDEGPQPASRRAPVPPQQLGFKFRH